jgi:hypothetical protein
MVIFHYFVIFCFQIAVVVFPSPEKENARFMKKCEEGGMQVVFADVLYEMLGNGRSFPNCVLMIFLSICFI